MKTELKTKTKTEIQIRLNKLETKRKYLYQFIECSYKGSDIVVKAKHELLAFDREIDTLKWVLGIDLPF